MTTFAHQSELKKLPIPDLEETVNRYLEVLKPLQTEAEHKDSIEACNNFLQTSGPILQKKLIEYSKTKASYVEQFWYDSYLNYDDPVVLNINPFVMIEDDPTPLKSTQISRAASLTASALRFIRALLQTDEQSRHIVVLSRSQFYWFDVLTDDDELLMNEEDIRRNFKHIVQDSDKTSISDLAKSSFGILTTENRRVWAKLRLKMKQNKTNNNILKIIDDALFIIVLDNIATGDDLTRMAKNFLCGESKLENGVQVGTCTNRWYDKLQIILTKDAKCGINFEHTGVDGHTVLRFASDIYTDSILRFAKKINNNSPSLWSSYSPNPELNKSKYINKYNFTPRKLEWELTTDLSLALRFGGNKVERLDPSE
ncbi:hypothetical protein HII12_005478 [Brettanomyces bruxellensis]|uniref:Choline/carnitine acyltransferase domain-containing protein n=1 Tax=Dekkera bruxellensis TaxID=5007 RepID=A0A8H6EQ35_DEKBR|nr:hypothetical protein HII12_005478 [Brettanomyces bruxellensis]